MAFSQYPAEHFYLFFSTCSKNEEDLERSHDMLQRELRALLEMEGECETPSSYVHLGLFRGKDRG